MLKAVLLATLVLGSTLTFANEADVTDVAFEAAETLAVDCPANYESQPYYVWSKELRKFVFAGYKCVKVIDHKN
ncbi:hypothetical protein DOM21_18415 [Bacteriovorax stolpii]|uniref:Uncharacterized protein n=1 Tax=Bacteriovorax stolpii TaxID=960 RepID=A0A2K9NME0_BACTC|nr:hypothetical protein [Bacteriovorax stolpii]AUN96680.1 hypothetical protein C0V70_00860 [Bacteriovorax stolpii]QDK43389.1 hypothetical protein DOM21_18415 [Bacteriovorax stolpii]TDP53800.1 hypothetical protein C8D79_1076 [Bacteriovorax stolpii]